MSILHSTAAQKTLTGLGFVPGIGSVTGLVSLTANAVSLGILKKPHSLTDRTYYSAKSTSSKYSGSLISGQNAPGTQLGTRQTDYALTLGSYFAIFQKGYSDRGQQHGCFLEGNTITTFTKFRASMEIMKGDSLAYLQAAEFQEAEKEVRTKFVSTFLDALLKLVATRVSKDGEVTMEDVDHALLCLYKRVSYLEQKEENLNGISAGALSFFWLPNFVNAYTLAQGPFANWKVADQLNSTFKETP